MATPTLSTTLVIMYFVTTPVHVPDGESKKIQEQNANWTLQTTSQIQTEDPDSCLSIGIKMAKEFEVVNTSTVRLYCICPKGATALVCLNREEKIRAAERENQMLRKNEPNFVEPEEVKTQAPTLLRIGPNTPDPLRPKDSRGR
ncbi:hypothetical protein [Bradyrhizobium oligotrophicum]|uniref:hypothetical protein n=1 Tax=Bradyrhizobium oligotrophicum TaxID=44255 RepID=UPI003EB790B5